MSCRTVVTGAPYLNTYEVICPLDIAS